MKKWKIDDNCTIHMVLGGFYNAYLLLSNKDAILIDTGRSNNNTELQQNIKKLIGQLPLSYLILTHTHYDHCENAASIKENWGSKVIVSDREAGYLKKGSTPLPKGTRFFTRVLSNLGNRFATSWYLYAPVNADIEISDTYSINDDVRVISTPGHSDGSIAIVVKDQIALVGDTLFGSLKGGVLPHFADDKKQLFKTWKMLLTDTSCHTFLPGHGKPISRQRLEKEVENYR